MGSHFNRTDGSTCPLFCRQGRSPASLLLPCRFEKEKKARPTVPAQVPKYPTTQTFRAQSLCACPERTGCSLNTNNFLDCHMDCW